MNDDVIGTKDILQRLSRLEHQNRTFKMVLVLAFLFLLLTAMTPQRGPSTNPTITANQIVLVRSDGKLFAKIAVDEKQDDLVLSGEDGTRRLWISGLADVNIPPFTALTITDPGQAMHAGLRATNDGAVVGLYTPNDQQFTVDARLPSLSRQVVMKVDRQAGSLSFI